MACNNTSQFLTVYVGQLSRHNVAQLSSQTWHEGVSRFVFLSGDSRGESTPKFIQAGGKIPVMVTELRSFGAVSWHLPWALETSFQSLHVACISESQQKKTQKTTQKNARQVLLILGIWLPLPPSAGRKLCFWGSSDLIGLTHVQGSR